MKNIYRSKNIDQLPGNCRTLIWVEKWYGMPSISKSTRSSDAHIRQYLWVIHSWWLVQRPLYLKKERKSISKLKRIIKIIKLLRNYLLTRTRVKRLVKLLNNLYKKQKQKKTHQNCSLLTPPWWLNKKLVWVWPVAGSFTDLTQLFSNLTAY